jgi:hypothetical protein
MRDNFSLGPQSLMSRDHPAIHDSKKIDFFWLHTLSDRFDLFDLLYTERQLLSKYLSEKLVRWNVGR